MQAEAFGSKKRFLYLVAVIFVLTTSAARAATDVGDQSTPSPPLRPEIKPDATPTQPMEELITRPSIQPFTKGEALTLKVHKDVGAPAQPFSLYKAALYASRNFPEILKKQAEVRASTREVTVQKIKEYNPYSLMSYQQVVATHNKETQILFSSPVLPPNPGPGLDFVSMMPQYFSGCGFILDWAPIDFGLHKARIQQAKVKLKYAQADYAVTQLDVVVQACSAFLVATVMQEQVKAANANVRRFQDFSRVVHSLVDADLRPGADASLADAQLANAQNDLIRARLQLDLALAEFAKSLGLAGQQVSIDPGAITVTAEPADLQTFSPQFDLHPFALRAKASILNEAARRRVLDKEYYPVFRWLGGMNFRGTSLDIHGKRQSANATGFATAVPNWNVGLVIDFPFMDIIRIQAEKKVVNERISAEQHNYDLILQQLKTDDVQSRARVKAAVQLAANMPIQVDAALRATRQAQARYEAGLATVAQVAEANQVLADSRVKEAVAKIGVWQALLAVAAVHGEVKPLLEEANRFQGKGN